MYTLARSTQYLILLVILTAGAVMASLSHWSGNLLLHGTIESFATALAVMIGILALIRHYSHPSSSFLILGTAFLGTAAMDAVHLLVTVTQAIADPGLVTLRPVSWSWLASRVFLSSMLCASLGIWIIERQTKRPCLISDRHIYIATGILLLVEAGTFLFYPSSVAYTADGVISRPQELLPGFCFAVATALYWWKGRWRTSTHKHWLLMSLIIATSTHLLYMSYSSTMHDPFFMISHVLKVFSYACVLIGLLLDTMESFRVLEAHTVTIEESVRKLQAVYHIDNPTTAGEETIPSRSDALVLDKQLVASVHEQAALAKFGADMLIERHPDRLFQNALFAVSCVTQHTPDQIQPVLMQYIRARYTPLVHDTHHVDPLETLLGCAHPTPGDLSIFTEEQLRHVTVVSQLFCVALDRLQHEAELKNAMISHELALQSSGSALWDIAMGDSPILSTHTPTTYSLGFLQLMGYSSDHFPPRLESWLACVYFPDQARVLEALQSHMDNRTTCHIVYRVMTPAGDLKWYATDALAQWNDAGYPIRMAGTIRPASESYARFVLSSLGNARTHASATAPTMS